MSDLTLFYRGPLRSNGDVLHKHSIRKKFHRQVKRFVENLEAEHKDAKLYKILDSVPQDLYSATKVAGVSFIAPTTTDQDSKRSSVRLSIQLLRPQIPGKIISSGGDIDNRLKTLFDALQIPDQNHIRKIDFSEFEEEPFYCLLEDDQLISAVTVETSQLLDTEEGSQEVVLIVDATFE